MRVSTMAYILRRSVNFYRPDLHLMILMIFSSNNTDKTTERSEGKATTTTKPTSQTLEILRMKTEVGKDGTGIQF